jgi:hypothetical protein
MSSESSSSSSADQAVSYDQATDTFGWATEGNLNSPLREHQIVLLPGEGEVWLVGDVHDHRRNFEKAVRSADLANHPDRHVVLQELIHGDHFDDKGAEESWITLFRAAEWKAQFPNQVHFLLANHDLAQIHGKGIMKGSTSVCEAFNKGVKKAFGERAGRIQVAITEFLLSFPLAVRSPNGLFFCHSLPQDDQIEQFDYSVFGRELMAEDYARRTGPVYQLIWGRGVTPPFVQQFAEAVGANILVTGHQPQDAGYLVNGYQHLIIASDHNQGVMLQTESSIIYDMSSLVGCLRKFVSIDL